MSNLMMVLLVTLCFIAADIVTGILKAVHEKDLSSEKMREGLWHKGGYIGIVILAVGIEFASTIVDLGFDVPLTVVTCVYVVITEALSILENLCALNGDLAKTPIALALHSQADTSEEEKEGEE